MSANAPASGLFASLTRLLGTGLELAWVRLQLLSNEIELEKRRLFDGLLLALVALLLLGVGLTLLSGFLVLLVADAYRLLALGLVSLGFLLAGVLLLRAARQSLRSPDGLFSASMAELARDRAVLKVQSRNGTS